MDYTNFDIQSLSDTVITINTDGSFDYNIAAPSFIWDTGYNFESYIVPKEEEMRIDLVINSMYNGVFDFKDLDVILYLNNIDNPLNIIEGMVLIYPIIDDFDQFRYTENGEPAFNKDITKTLSVPNKTTRIDPNRQNYIDNGYSLPPVVNTESKSPIVTDSSNIIIGGLG
jgi:hypothetical protein